MHSSVLRGSDFQLSWRDREVPHADFFRHHTRDTRVGLLAPDGTEGVGAVTLAMACVTAFYDRFRTTGSEFLAYPDFFTFQRGAVLANYGSFDFWPDKDVRVPHDHNRTVALIADRAINVLLVPDTPAVERRYDRVQLDRTRRTLTRCFAYGATGKVPNPDLTIRCAIEPFRTYAWKVIHSTGADVPGWLATANRGSALTQSFRELCIDDTLARL